MSANAQQPSPGPAAGAPGPQPYGAPVQPPYAAPVQPPYGAPVRPSTGGLPWGLGLLVLTLVPGVSAVVACVAMMVAGLMGRRQPGTAGVNAAKAASWGLTYLLATLLLIGAHVLVLANAPEDWQGTFFPIGIPITIWLVVSLFHFVWCVVAMVRASHGRDVGFCGVPFFRAR